MAKIAKLTKLKSAIKRLPSFSKLARSNSSIAASNDADNDHKLDMASSKENVRAVYVGSTRRRYLLSSDIIRHPVFQELVDRSSGSEDDEDGEVVVVACEVVLFEHLLWMLQSGGSQLGSLEELAQFYCTS